MGYDSSYDSSSSGSVITPAADNSGWAGLFGSLITGAASAYDATQKTNAAADLANAQAKAAQLNAQMAQANGSNTSKMLLIGGAIIASVLLVVMLFRK